MAIASVLIENFNDLIWLGNITMVTLQLLQMVTLLYSDIEFGFF